MRSGGSYAESMLKTNLRSEERKENIHQATSARRIAREALAAIIMKTRTFFYSLLSIAIAGIIIFIPLIFVCDIEKALTLGANLLIACAALSTFIIALLFYDKFGIGKKILDKQTETVIELLEKCKNIHFIVENTIDTQKGVTEILIIRGFSKDLSYFKSKIRNEKFVFFNFNNYNNEMNQVLSFSKNIWLPPEIKGVLSFLDLYSLNGIDLSSSIYKDNYIFININGRTPKEEKFNIGKKNDNEIKYLDFIENIEKSVLSIEKWINQHSNIKFQLNI